MPLIKEALEKIYLNTNPNTHLNKELFEASYNNFAHALIQGFGIPSYSTVLPSPDIELLSKLHQSAIYFTARKTVLQVMQLTALLPNEEKATTRSFAEFKKLSKGIIGSYNQEWLLTEYTTATVSARVARQWQGFLADADLYPNIKYLHTSSPNPRAEHEVYVGTVLPINHVWWLTHTPPIDWNCDCGITNTDEESTELPEEQEPVPLVFQNNPAISGELFNIPAHTYVTKTSLIPDAVIQHELKTRILPELKSYFPLYQNGESGSLAVHPAIAESEFKVNVKEGLILAKNGYHVQLQPERFTSGLKNPDAIINGIAADFKAPTTKTAINTAIKAVAKQRCEIAVLAVSDIEKTVLADALREALGNQEKNRLVQTVIIRYPDNTIVSFKREEFRNREFATKLK